MSSLVEIIIDSNIFYIAEEQIRNVTKKEYLESFVLLKAINGYVDNSIVFNNLHPKNNTAKYSFILNTDHSNFHNVIQFLRGYKSYEDIRKINTCAELGLINFKSDIQEASEKRADDFKATEVMGITSNNPVVEMDRVQMTRDNNSGVIIESGKISSSSSEYQNNKSKSIFSKSKMTKNDIDDIDHISNTYGEYVSIISQNSDDNFADANVFKKLDTDTQTVLLTEHNDPKKTHNKQKINYTIGNSVLNNTSYDDSSQRRYIRSRKIELNTLKR